MYISTEHFLAAGGKKVPRRDVRRLPDTAESIFCPADISTSTSGSLESFILTDLLDPAPFDDISCPCPGHCSEFP